MNALSNDYSSTLLKRGLSEVTEEWCIKNYHPDYNSDPANIFYILANNGRYREGHGRYYVFEEDNRFISCFGWNQYELDSNIALIFTRLYTIPEYRNLQLHHHSLDRVLEETARYPIIYATYNLYNKKMYDRYLYYKEHGKNNKGKYVQLYDKFTPIGIKEVYYTRQYVCEYRKQLPTENTNAINLE